MNIAFLLTPRNEVSCIRDDFTLRQGLEKLRCHGYTAIPVVDRENKYIGTVSEGDFLWYLVEDPEAPLEKTSLKSVEDVIIRDVLNIYRNPAVPITAPLEEVFQRATSQNFIPVVDDLNSFIGIITRQSIIRHYMENLSLTSQPAACYT